MPEISIQFADDAPPMLFVPDQMDARFDQEHWERLEWETPTGAGGKAPPVVEWLFISSRATIAIEPLSDINGIRVCKIPSFSRAEIYPVHFGFPPRLEQEYPDEIVA